MELQEMVKEIKENIEKGQMETKATVEELKKKVEEIEVKAARPQGGQVMETKENKYFDGQKAARLWKAQVVAGQDKISVGDALTQIYGQKDANFVEECKSLMASGNGGELIEEQYYREILPLLYNNTIFDKMGVARVPMPNGNLTIRKMIAGTTAQYVGESKTVKASQAKFAKLKLSSKKLTVKTVISNDLLRSATPEADKIVRDDLLMQLRIAMDYHALYGAGTEYTPTGIANADGVNKVVEKAVIDGDKLYSDLVTPLKKSNIPMENLGWVMNPDVYTKLYNETFPNGNYKYRDELKQGKFHGYPFVESNQIVTGSDKNGTVDVFFGSFKQFMIGEQLGLEVKVSEEASYLDENGVTQSAFDNDETVIKGLMIHDFGVAYGKAFSMGTYYTKE